MTKSKCHPVGDNYMYKQLCIFQLLPNKPEVTLHLTTAVYSTKHYFHYWPTGKPLVFFPCISVFPSALSWETLIFLGKKTYTYFPPGPATKFTWNYVNSWPYKLGQWRDLYNDTIDCEKAWVILSRQDTSCCPLIMEALPNKMSVCVFFTWSPELKSLKNYTSMGCVCSLMHNVKLITIIKVYFWVKLWYSKESNFQYNIEKLTP